MRRLLATLVLGVSAGLLLVGTATAYDPAVIDQYQEQIPSAGGGGHDSGGGSGGGGSSQDGSSQGSSNGGASNQGGGSSPTYAQIESSVGPATATQLEALVKSSPAKAEGKKQGTNGMTSKEAASAPSPPSGSVLADAVGAASAGDEGHLLAVLLGGVGIALLGVTAAFMRRRGSSGKPAA